MWWAAAALALENDLYAQASGFRAGTFRRAFKFLARHPRPS